MYLPLLVCAKAAERKSLPHTGRQWPASGAPMVGERGKIMKKKKRRGDGVVSVA